MVTLHSHGNLAEVESSLKGGDLEALEGLNVSASKYNIAFNALWSRYDSSRSLISYHIKEIFNMRSKESLARTCR